MSGSGRANSNRVATAITLAGIALNFAMLGSATIFLNIGLVAAYFFWRIGRWRPDRKRVLAPYLLCLGLFCGHFAEEYFTGFYRDFPALFGTEWSSQRFLVFNFIWLAAFMLSAIGVYFQQPAAYLLVIFLAVGGGIANGAGHIILSFVQDRYFPGTATAPLMLASGLFLLYRLGVAGVLRSTQAVIFTVLVLGTVTWWLPRNLFRVDWTVRHQSGWIPIVLGAVLYFWCALQFLLRGKGTPNISFARPLGFLIGKEPVRLVSQSIYRFSRNPMYVGVITIVFGEALLVGSLNPMMYGLALCLWFHLVVVFIEEPHLRKTRGDTYKQYCAETPRWLPRLGL
jgi:protein-S-isoprenylcysteine O-methyltransferase Ste14